MTANEMEVKDLCTICKLSAINGGDCISCYNGSYCASCPSFVDNREREYKR